MAKDSLLSRLHKNSTLKMTSLLGESTYLNEKDLISVPIHALNIAFSGELKGGFAPGITCWAGASKSFKTMFSLIMAKAYMDKYKDAVLMFYDCEFGATKDYFKSMNIDMDRCLHVPFMNLEELKFDLIKQLENITRGEKIIIIIDSIGNVASKKELDDALEGKSTADMTRAKQIKSLFRMVTPHLTTKDIPCVVVNHIYMTQEMFSKAVVSGGCLAYGTKLKMFDGEFKEIQNIGVGDLVATLNGNKPVTNIWTPETLENGTPICYEMEFDDGYKVTCSENHPFLTSSGWVEAKDLNESHIIVTM